ncbi:hypothetical protein [Methanosphaera sp. WGK6]|uniref:hypothetical protein n=1 Tax=Methanosphaera sp. WGK6 TaxID=1561964 RepID=UPI00084CA699|nr:hypothetical protein [Methanosphaera sp. WGK6]OED30534.1 hypothetical protein NL43_02645 [Methanosphaera sp. WGK6]
MIRCPNCDFENYDKTKYCVDCGKNLTNIKQTNTFKLRVSLILAIILPGISYFYLKQIYKGLMFLMLFPLLFFNFLFIGGEYMICYPISINLITLFLEIIFVILYLFQIYDIIKITKKANNFLD